MGGMWTKEHRARQLAFEQGRRYPTDLTDAEWEQVRPLLPKPPRRGRTPRVDLREVLNAIRYMARSGGGWRMLPIHFGPWQTVYWWFRRLVRRLLFQTVHDVMLMLDREQAEREASPTAGVVDSQTVKAPSAPGGGGYDAAKRTKGRKLPDQKGFQVLPRRWVVERTFGWMTRWRRLVRDYETRLDVSDAMIHLSMGALLLRRVAHPSP